VLSADVSGSNELRVRFDDGVQCVRNFSDATEGELQADLADIDFLRRVSVDSERRMLVWPNGFGMDLDMVHATATLRQRELTLGPQHPETLAACFRLAYLYLAHGDTEAAMDVGKPLDEAPAEVVAAITKRLLGDLEHEFGTDDSRVQALRDALPAVFRAAGACGDANSPEV
jgi:hypothetical protein